MVTNGSGHTKQKA